MTDITVAICTRNGAHRLSASLAALAGQEGLAAGSWDVLLADNGSTDDTKQVFGHFCSSHPQVPCSYLCEPAEGVSVVRRRALREAQGAWVVFVDDDNVVERDYLAEAVRFAEGRPTTLGAFGGRSVEGLACAAPPWLDPLKAGLAIWDGGDHARRLLPRERAFTAGLAVRTAAVRPLLAERWLMGGRTASSLVAGEDLELCLKLERAGWERWYNPGMRFTHVLPSERYELPYLRRLYETFGATHLLLHPYFAGAEGAHVRYALTVLSALAKYPYFSMLSRVSTGVRRWQRASRAWTYSGVLRMAVKRLTQKEAAVARSSTEVQA